jgi:hypothetical protein
MRSLAARPSLPKQLGARLGREVVPVEFHLPGFDKVSRQLRYRAELEDGCDIRLLAVRTRDDGRLGLV